MNSNLKWIAGMIAGTTNAVVNIDANKDKKLQATEVLTAVNKIIAEAFDDLPASFDLGAAIVEARNPELKAAAIEEFVTKFDLTNDSAERIVELTFQLLIEALSIEKKDTEEAETVKA